MGDPHIMENGPRTDTWDYGKELVRILHHGLKAAYHGGGGEITKFVCGYMMCEPRLGVFARPAASVQSQHSQRPRLGGGGKVETNSVSEAEPVPRRERKPYFQSCLKRYLRRL